MKQRWRTILIGLGTVAMLTSLTPGAWSQVAGGGGVGGGSGGGVAHGVERGGGELESGMEIKGRIVCVNCTLEEARNAYPNLDELYQLTRATPDKGQLVMQLSNVNHSMWWETLVGLNQQFPVRVEEQVWQKLMAEENLFKDIEILGILRKSRILDIAKIKVGDITLSELERGKDS